jgi:hypothetical protein
LQDLDVLKNIIYKIFNDKYGGTPRVKSPPLRVKSPPLRVKSPPPRTKSPPRAKVYTKSDLNALTIPKLKEICESSQIKVPSKANKGERIEIMLKHFSNIQRRSSPRAKAPSPQNKPPISVSELPKRILPKVPSPQNKPPISASEIPRPEAEIPRPEAEIPRPEAEIPRPETKTPRPETKTPRPEAERRSGERSPSREVEKLPVNIKATPLPRPSVKPSGPRPPVTRPSKAQPSRPSLPSVQPVGAPRDSTLKLDEIQKRVQMCAGLL